MNHHPFSLHLAAFFRGFSAFRIPEPRALSYRATAAAVLSTFVLTFVSGAALLAQAPAPLASAILQLQDVEDGGLLSIEGGAIAQEATFVCMAEFDDTLPPCEPNADGELGCWGEIGALASELTLCVVGFGLPLFKAWKAADKAWDAIQAARAAEAAAAAAVSMAFTAIAAVLKDMVRGGVMDAVRDLVDCAWG